MTRTIVARVALLVMGIVVWGYGVRAGDTQLRLIGIGLLAASLILRFFKRRPPAGNDDDDVTG
ncbi:MAG: hypothetical protein H0X64_07545 [Gemmatimonadaceae bacterium]|nr:hypothetical protein [Gemmatimonadaceae bacterium]